MNGVHLVDEHGIECVFVAPEVASRIARPLRIAVESVLRRDYIDASPETRAFLADLERAANDFRSRKRPDLLVSADGNDFSGLPDRVSAPTAAKELKVSVRRVGQLCTAGYLVADKGSRGEWLVTVQSIIELQEERK